MKILISAGVKTENIVKGIEKKFKSSGDEFIIVQYLEDIGQIFARGEYFDKAIIGEQSVTHEYEIEDEDEVRKRINEFANNMASKNKKYEYVFLTQDYDLAEITYEEILPILDESAVVLAPPPYQVKFFTNLVVTDVKQLESEIVYKPKPIETESPDDLTVDISDDELDNHDIVQMQAPSDMNELLKPNEVIGNDRDINDEIIADNGLNIDAVPGAEFTFDNTENIPEQQEQDLVQIDDIPLESEPDAMNDVFGGSDFDINFDQQVQQSGDLPDYTVDSKPQDSPLIGFDVDFDDDSQQYTGTDDSASQYQQDVGQTQNIPQDYNQNYIQSQDTYQGQDPNSLGPGFSSDDYGYNNDNQQYSNNQQYGNNTGFSADDYASQGMAPVQEQDNYNTEGFDPNYYSEDQYTQQEQELEPQNFQQEQPAPMVDYSEKKRGFLKRKNKAAINLNPDKYDPTTVKNNLAPFAARGNSIVVTGCGGCGTSTVAYSLANIISQLGYSVLLVDMDTQSKTQSYISKTNYESMEVEEPKLLAAVNSSTGIGQNIAIVKQGFHLATMGLATDSVSIDSIIKKEKLPRFINSCKSSHNFVIYDVPFLYATDYLSDIIYMTDNLVLVADASTWGLTKMMIYMTNVDSEDMQDTLFTKTQLVFNRYRNLHKLLGQAVRTGADITRVLDKKLIELTGEDPGLHFADLRIAGIINDDPDFEKAWFEDVQYSDTGKGQRIFLELINNIILGK